MKFGNTLKSIRPEDDLLLCCARTSLDSQRKAHIKKLVQGGVDWSYLTERSLRHGLTPLLYRNLNATCPEAVPKTLLDQLREYYNVNARRSLSWIGYLIRILHLLESKNISAIPFKGPSLGATIYGDLALRPFSDLDLLVREQDVEKVKDLLVDQGYQFPLDLSQTQAAAFLRSECALSLTHRDSKLKLDIHWRIVPRYFNLPIDFEDLSERANRGESRILALSPEDTLLVLCVHGVKHLWAQLVWICDIAELIGTYPLDWESVLKVSRSLGSQRILFLGLFLAKELLDAPLPEEISKRVETDSVVGRLAEQVQKPLFQNVEEMPGLVENSLFHVKARECLQDRLWYWARLSTTPGYEDWACFPLPTVLFPLYSILRPFRLAAKYGPEVFKMVSGRNLRG